MAALGSGGALVSVLADGRAVYSADFTEAPPSPGSVFVYSGANQAVHVVSVGGGVETQFSDGLST
jgi:hypothetical protein